MDGKVANVRWLVMILLLIAGVAGASRADEPAVNYVSADGVYINVGRYGGVAVGTRITVLRDGANIAVLEVTHVSSHSAACRIVEETAEPRAGDRIAYAPTEFTPPQPLELRRPRAEAGDPAPTVRAGRDRVRGYLALQHMLLQDQSGSGLTTLQPAVSGRVVVEDVAGSRGTFSMRFRSRLYYRPSLNEREWSHRLSEFAFRFGDSGHGLAWGFGRTVVDDVHGLGYIDGAFAAMRLSQHYRTGVILGFEPGSANGEFRPDSRKFGSFVTWDGGSRATQRLALTAALSGSYFDGVIDREFGYLQVVYGFRDKLQAYGSAEVDLNREWREVANGGRFSFSNFISTVNFTPTPAVALDFAWDARQSVHDYNTFDTPDSLFDDNLYSGYGGGVTLSRGNVQLRARGGVRFRETSEETNRYYQISATARQFPAPGYLITARWAVSQTPFVTGYRPTVTLRFPLGRRLRMNAGAGGYFYEQGIVDTKTYFGEAGAYYTLGRRYYLSGDVRQYVGGTLESLQFFAECGVNF